jgi:hypothetical protein
MTLSAFKEPRLECWKMERSMKALFVLLFLSVLFGCQKNPDQASSPVAAPAATKVTEQTGRVVINPQFDAALRFADGLAAVRIGDENTGKWGYIDKQGKMVINAQFDDAWSFAEGLAVMRMGGKWSYIDKQGKMVANPQFDVAHPFVDGLAAVRIGDESTGKWGYIDKQGKIVVNLQFDSAEPFAEGLAAVRNGDKWGYISR